MSEVPLYATQGQGNPGKPPSWLPLEHIMRDFRGGHSLRGAYMAAVLVLLTFAKIWCGVRT